MSSAIDILNKYKIQTPSIGASDILKKYNVTQETQPIEPVNKYTGLEKFIVGATPIATSIGGGILGAVGGLPGIVAGGAAGAATGRLLADQLEEAFGGEDYTAEETLKRAGTDALIDTAFTLGTFGVGKAIGKGISSNAFKPVKDAILKKVQPIKKTKILEKLIERKSYQVLSTENAIKNQVENLTKQTKIASKIGLKDIKEGLIDISDTIDDVLTNLKPELDSGMNIAKTKLNEGFQNILKVNGDKQLRLPENLITQIDELTIDNSIKDMLKQTIARNTGGQVVPKEILQALQQQGITEPKLLQNALSQLGFNQQSSDVLQTTVSKADDIKRGFDDIIGMMSTGKKVNKKFLQEVMDIQDNIITSISKATDDNYIKLSANWRRMMQVDKNINKALGAIGTGATETVRGGEFLKSMTSAVKNIKEADNIFAPTEGFLGRLNSQINLLNNIGMHDVAISTKKGLSELTESIMKKSDYEKTEKILKSINDNMKAGQKLSVSDIKKMFDIENIGELKKSFGTIIEQQKGLKALEKKQSKQKIFIKKAMAELASPELQKFSSFNDRYIPMIVATTISSVVPGAGQFVKPAAGLYTLRKLYPEAVYLLSNAMKKLEEEALKKVIVPNHKIAINKFFTGLINNIRNDSDF
jgi:hypothetical protein